MITRHTSFASISVLELIAGAAGLVLFAASLTAFAQAPNGALPAAAPPAAPAPSAPPISPSPAVEVNGKPPVASQQGKVLADPDTKMYSRCTTADEHAAPGDAERQFKPNSKAQVMSEEAAKAKGFRAGAHRVTCK